MFQSSMNIQHHTQQVNLIKATVSITILFVCSQFEKIHFKIKLITLLPFEKANRFRRQTSCDDYDSGVLLDANENALRPTSVPTNSLDPCDNHLTLERYPCPYQISLNYIC